MGQTGQLERQSAVAPLNQLLLSALAQEQTLKLTQQLPSEQSQAKEEEEKLCKRRFFCAQKRGFILKKYSFEERKRHTIGFSQFVPPRAFSKVKSYA